MMPCPKLALVTLKLYFAILISVCVFRVSFFRTDDPTKIFNIFVVPPTQAHHTLLDSSTTLTIKLPSFDVLLYLI
jgi:hypothetical protein